MKEPEERLTRTEIFEMPYSDQIIEMLISIDAGIHDLHAALAEHASAGQTTPEPVRWVTLTWRGKATHYRADQILGVAAQPGHSDLNASNAMIYIGESLVHYVDQTPAEVRAAIDRAKEER